MEAESEGLDVSTLGKNKVVDDVNVEDESEGLDVMTIWGVDKVVAKLCIIDGDIVECAIDGEGVSFVESLNWKNPHM